MAPQLTRAASATCMWCRQLTNASSAALPQPVVRPLFINHPIRDAIYAMECKSPTALHNPAMIPTHWRRQHIPELSWLSKSQENGAAEAPKLSSLAPPLALMPPVFRSQPPGAMPKTESCDIPGVVLWAPWGRLGRLPGVSGLDLILKLASYL